jgi:GntR family transcriptional regulator
MNLTEPTPEAALSLHLNAGEKVYLLRRLRFVNGQPVAVVTSYLPARLFAGIDKFDLEGQSLYHIIEHIYKRKLQRAEEVIGAVVAEGAEAQILQTAPGSPLLLIKETTCDVQRIPIEYSISLLRADRYTATVLSVRKK